LRKCPSLQSQDQTHQEGDHQAVHFGDFNDHGRLLCTSNGSYFPAIIFFQQFLRNEVKVLLALVLRPKKPTYLYVD
jgi:hypothetical protein